MVYGFSLILLNAEKKINPDVSWVYDLCLTMWGKKERKDFFFYRAVYNWIQLSICTRIFLLMLSTVSL